MLIALIDLAWPAVVLIGFGLAFAAFRTCIARETKRDLYSRELSGRVSKLESDTSSLAELRDQLRKVSLKVGFEVR